MHVLIIGYGEMGQAMERLLADHHTLRIWQRRDDEPLEVVLEGPQLVLLCVPAVAHASLLTRLQGLAEHTVVATIAKGLDAAGRTLPEILAADLPGHLRPGFIYGPMIAERLQAGQQGYAAVGGMRAEDRARLVEAFAATQLHVRPTRDTHGLAWCALLKNVYTIGISAAVALELGENVIGALVVQAIDEMREVVRRVSGDEVTAIGYGGLGDLVTTFSSADSNHQRIGRRLALEGPPAGQGEGVNTLSMIARHGRTEARDLPLYAAVDDAVNDRRPIGPALLAALRH